MSDANDQAVDEAESHMAGQEASTWVVQFLVESWSRQHADLRKQVDHLFNAVIALAMCSFIALGCSTVAWVYLLTR